MPHLFDFDAFLKDPLIRQALSPTLGSYLTDPGSECPGSKDYEVVELTGGLVNVTVRVITRKGNSERTVILKYAPPFIAASLEKIPFGEFRQVRSIFSFQHDNCSMRSSLLEH